ncbi:hypothetical protein PIB30_015528 [Stylosanthes scabra]|uniref:Uncharacterized protein n=1 Tax=Stylosanthes scabra TaxID=79078 RepID=A0ABU6Z4K2_9FABA|nr:hypothetical protein [Stylosanthes scabra]
MLEDVKHASQIGEAVTNNGQWHLIHQFRHLGQRIEEVSDETRPERARATEAASLKFDAIQSSLTQIMHKQSRSRSPSGGFCHGSKLRVPDDKQICIAAIHMTGPTISWFQMSQRSALSVLGINSREQPSWNLPPDALKDCFISGLQADIRREVKAACPPSLMRALTMA